MKRSVVVNILMVIVCACVSFFVSDVIERSNKRHKAEVELAQRSVEEQNKMLTVACQVIDHQHDEAVHFVLDYVDTRERAKEEFYRARDMLYDDVFPNSTTGMALSNYCKMERLVRP